MPQYPKIAYTKIRYNSPSGYVNIGKYIPPFERVENGFGFHGLLVEDSTSGKLQCHICGRWFEQMSIHLKNIHSLNCKEYKIKFGLLQSTALKSKKMRLAQSKIMQKLRRKNKSNNFVFKRKNKFSGNRKNLSKALEHRNRFGVCDLQIMQKVIDLYKKLGKTPTLTDLSNEYGFSFVTTISKRYSSYIKYCYSIGLNPNYSNFNPKYSKQYFINKFKNKKPALRLLTTNESRALYKYFPKGINSIKQESTYEEY
jgi:hypothetical protein